MRNFTLAIADIAVHICNLLDIDLWFELHYFFQWKKMIEHITCGRLQDKED